MAYDPQGVIGFDDDDDVTDITYTARSGLGLLQTLRWYLLCKCFNSL